MNIKHELSLLLMVVLIIGGFFLATKRAETQNAQFTKEQTLYVEAVTSYQKGNFGQAEKSIRPLMKMKPSSEAANEIAAWTYYKLENYKSAAKYARKALKLNPHRVEDMEFLLMLCTSFAESGQTKEAKLVYKELDDNISKAFYWRNQQQWKSLTRKLTNK